MHYQGDLFEHCFPNGPSIEGPNHEGVHSTDGGPSSPDGKREKLQIVDVNFTRMRELLTGKIISTMWWTDSYNPQRIFRPDPRKDRGRGANLLRDMQAAWLSSEFNIVGFPIGAPHGNDSFLERMRQTNVLNTHDFAFVDELNRLHTQYEMPIYNIDDLPYDWDDFVVNGSTFTRYANTKSNLRELSAHAVDYEVHDAKTVTVEDFNRIAGPQQVAYIKLDNTETGNLGTRVVHSQEQFDFLMDSVNRAALGGAISSDVVIQSPVHGQNRSIEFFMTPEHPNEVFFMGRFKKYVDRNEAKPNKPSLRLRSTAAGLHPTVKTAVIDCVKRIRSICPEAFGFVALEYIYSDGNVHLYDLKFRPSTGTTISMIHKMLKERYGIDFFASSTFITLKNAKLKSFENFMRPFDERGLGDVDSLDNNKFVALPISYNYYRGEAYMAIFTENRQSMDDNRQLVRSLPHYVT